MRSNLSVTLNTDGELLGCGAWGGFWKEKKIDIKSKERRKYLYLEPEKLN